MNNTILPDLGISVSVSLPIISILIFVVATIFVIIAAIYKKAGFAKVLHIVVILLCAVSITITSITGVDLINTKNLINNQEEANSGQT